MSKKETTLYRTTVEDEHWRNEEFQWVRILASGNPAKGMVLLYIQKACTAFHEFEPAWREGALKPDQIPFFRKRLAQRVRQVLTTIENNGLSKLNGTAQLTDVLHSIEAAESGDELAELAERVHLVNHLLFDSLEGG